jgi:hypothetical protein
VCSSDLAYRLNVDETPKVLFALIG